MPDHIVRGRHINYIPDGTPIVRLLPSETCATNPLEFLHARQLEYTPAGLPRLAFAWECCDAFCFDSINPSECYKEPIAWPIGEGPGITYAVSLHAFDVNNCRSASNVSAILEYTAVTGKWIGSIELRGGTLFLAFSVHHTLPVNDPEKFTLEWSGCDTGSKKAGYNCDDPLMVAFGNIVLQDCCQCRSEISGTFPDQPITDQGPEVTFYVFANCRMVFWGRHVDYEYVIEAGTGTGTQILDSIPGTATTGTERVYPVIARNQPCIYTQGDASVCHMRCPLVATITAVGTGCTCMEGSFGMNYVGNQWIYDDGWPCPVTVGTIVMRCESIETGTGSPIASGYIRLFLDVTCGADNIGSAYVDIPAEELEDLDETFEVDMIGEEPGSCGTCTFQWNEMSMSWSNISDNCTGACICVEPPGNGISGAGMGIGDGETMITDCQGATPTVCCTSTIQVRVMRTF